MTTEQFLEDFQDLLQTDETVTPGASLKDMEEWDSMAVMACMAYFDKSFGIKTKFSQFMELDTVADVMRLAGEAVR